MKIPDVHYQAALYRIRRNGEFLRHHTYKYIDFHTRHDAERVAIAGDEIIEVKATVAKSYEYVATHEIATIDYTCPCCDKPFMKKDTKVFCTCDSCDTDLELRNGVAIVDTIPF